MAALRVLGVNFEFIIEQDWNLKSTLNLNFDFATRFKLINAPWMTFEIIVTCIINRWFIGHASIDLRRQY